MGRLSETHSHTSAYAISSGYLHMGIPKRAVSTVMPKEAVGASRASGTHGPTDPGSQYAC
jgi:hypothetical protein